MTGPYTPTSPLCLACYTPVDMASDPFLCPDCNLPMCNQQCAASEVHQQVGRILNLHCLGQCCDVKIKYFRNVNMRDDGT